MPKQRITKEMVVDAAFEIARKDGIEKATVKTIAEKLGCSVQPIYSYCKNMDGLKNDVAEKARTFILAEVGKTVDRNDLFRSTGQNRHFPGAVFRRVQSGRAKHAGAPGIVPVPVIREAWFRAEISVPGAPHGHRNVCSPVLRDDWCNIPGFCRNKYRYDCG